MCVTQVLPLWNDNYHTQHGMKKRKPTPFSATKAVKANARARVGQPKPARVLETEPREGRRIKHKKNLEELKKSED